MRPKLLADPLDLLERGGLAGDREGRVARYELEQHEDAERHHDEQRHRREQSSDDESQHRFSSSVGRTGAGKRGRQPPGPRAQGHDSADQP